MIEDNNSVMVTVLCRTYNHERFIRHALEGFVTQKTDFPFEVLVHDDASTDKTADIIREYAKKYPAIIKPIYQQINQHSQKISVIPKYMLPKANGKYLAWCEGDDYWTNPNKLQLQVEALESHPDCVACASEVEKISIKGRPLGRVSNLKTGGVIDGDEFVRYCLYAGVNTTIPVQLSGFMIRKSLYEGYLKNPPEFRSKFDVGDLPIFLFCGLHGNVFFYKEMMSCYRTGNPNSWSGRMSSSRASIKAHMDREKDALLSFDRYTGGRFHKEAERGAKLREFCYYRKANDIKGFRKPEMKEFYGQMTVKQKAKVYLFGLIPPFESIWHVYRNMVSK